MVIDGVLHLPDIAPDLFALLGLFNTDILLFQGHILRPMENIVETALDKTPAMILDVGRQPSPRHCVLQPVLGKGERIRTVLRFGLLVRSHHLLHLLQIIFVCRIE